MADARAGHLTFELVTGHVGFTVDGTFSPSAGSFPKLHFTYTEHLADGDHVSTLVSDGNTVTVDADGDEHVLSADAADRLQGSTKGFADLGFASWVDGPREDRQADGTVVTGRVNVADLLQDVVRLVSQINAKGDVKPLDDSTARQLGALAQTSTIEVDIDGDGVPRSVDADVGFGRDVPDALVDALGPYAASELEVKVTFAPQR